MKKGPTITGEIDHQTAERLMEAAEKAGHRLARSFYGIDADDITQEVLLAALKEWKFFSRLEPRALEAALTSKGRAYCSKELDYHLKASGQWTYTPEVVTRFLSGAFAEVDAWMDNPRNPDPSAIHREAEVAVYMWDLTEALHKLNEREHKVLIKRFRDGMRLDSADRAACSRAVEKICRLLNRRVPPRTRNHDGPGSRTAITNAHAIHQTTKAVDGA